MYVHGVPDKSENDLTAPTIVFAIVFLALEQVLRLIGEHINWRERPLLFWMACFAVIAAASAIAHWVSRWSSKDRKKEDSWFSILLVTPAILATALMLFIITLDKYFHPVFEKYFRDWMIIAAMLACCVYLLIKVATKEDEPFSPTIP